MEALKEIIEIFKEFDGNNVPFCFLLQQVIYSC